MGKHQQEYLHNVASNVMGQIGGVSYTAYCKDAWETDSSEFPTDVWQRHGSKILDAVRKMGPQARGRIAACGVAHGSSTGALCHWEVNEGKDLNAAYSGDELLSLLASYVVAAAIVDIIRAQVIKMMDEERERDEEFDRGMRDYVHLGPKASNIPHASRYTSVTGSRSITEGNGKRSERGTRSITHSVTGHSSKN